MSAVVEVSIEVPYEKDGHEIPWEIHRHNCRDIARIPSWCIYPIPNDMSIETFIEGEVAQFQDQEQDWTRENWRVMPCVGTEIIDEKKLRRKKGSAKMNNKPNTIEEKRKATRDRNKVNPNPQQPSKVSNGLVKSRKLRKAVTACKAVKGS